MTAIVSSELAEQAWLRVGALGERDILKLQNRSGKFQEELVGFVLGFTSKMTPESIGIAFYAMLVLFEMFQQAPNTTYRKVKDKTIMRLWRENHAACAALLVSDFDRDLMRVFVDNSSEPAALQYVIDALFEVQEEEGDLPATEVAQLLAIHKTIIDALHSAANRRSDDT